jgi:hypothetical protein
MRTLTVALLLAIAAPAAAQDAEARVETFTDADLVTGDIAGAWDGIIQTRRRRDRHSLIRARAHWIPELVKSVENL